MVNGAPEESEAVLAFMREQGAAVLGRAIEDLASCPAADLPTVTHAWVGTLGSYRLDAAHDLVAALQDVVRDPGSTAEDAAAARARTLTGLRALDGDSDRTIEGDVHP